MRLHLEGGNEHAIISGETALTADDAFSSVLTYKVQVRCSYGFLGVYGAIHNLSYKLDEVQRNAALFMDGGRHGSWK